MCASLGEVSLLPIGFRTLLLGLDLTFFFVSDLGFAITSSLALIISVVVQYVLAEAAFLSFGTEYADSIILNHKVLILYMTNVRLRKFLVKHNVENLGSFLYL
jgi:hypothetical protein